MTPPPGMNPQTILQLYITFSAACVIFYFIVLYYMGKPKAKSAEDILGIFNGRKTIFGLKIPYDVLFLSGVYIASLLSLAIFPFLDDWSYSLEKAGIGYIVPILVYTLLGIAGTCAVIIAIRTHLKEAKKPALITFLLANIILFFASIVWVFTIVAGDPWAIFGIGIMMTYLQGYFWGAFAVFALICYLDKIIPSIRKVTTSTILYRGLYHLYHFLIVVLIIAVFTVSAEIFGGGIFEPLQQESYVEYWEEQAEAQEEQAAIKRTQELIENGKCDELKDKNHDLCLAQKSLELGDTDERLELCQSISNPDIKNKCALNAAENTTNASRANTYCSMIYSSMRNECQEHYREIRDNPCLMETDAECPLFACKEQESKHRAYGRCYRNYAKEYGDAEGCGVLNGSDLCYYEVAIAVVDWNACESIEGAKLRADCIKETLSSIKGTSTCLDIRGEEYQVDCLVGVFRSETNMTNEEQGRFAAAMVER